MKQEKQKTTGKALKIILPCILLAVGIILLVFNFSKGSSAQNSNGKPHLEISETEYDFGTMPINGGILKKTFEIKNSGDGDLVIGPIWTSCHCTSAVFKLNGKQSPEFNMAKIPWSQKMAPGETGQIEVIFDPAFHGPAGIGEAIRAIFFETNDPQNESSEVRIAANVTP